MNSSIFFWHHQWFWLTSKLFSTCKLSGFPHFNFSSDLTRERKYFSAVTHKSLVQWTNMMQGCKLSSQDQTQNSPAAFLFPELTERLDDYTRTSTLMVVHGAVDEWSAVSHTKQSDSLSRTPERFQAQFFLFPVFLPSAWRKPGASYRPGMWSGEGGKKMAFLFFLG